MAEDGRSVLPAWTIRSESGLPVLDWRELAHLEPFPAPSFWFTGQAAGTA